VQVSVYLVDWEWLAGHPGAEERVDALCAAINAETDLIEWLGGEN
jgi:hypothetical protein